MYFIDIHIQADRVPADKAEELLEGHRAWFSEQAQVGNFLLLGPYRDQAMAGLVLAQAESKEALQAIIAQDVYYPDLARYDIREFQANVIAANIVDYKGK